MFGNNAESKAHCLTVAATKKSYLRNIQKQFSPAKLYAKSSSQFANKEGLHIYNNDSRYIPDYYDQCFRESYTLTKIESEKEFKLLDSLNKDSKEFSLGIVVGNGSVLSLLSEIPADDILLVDVEPAVHYFILKVKELIINTSPDEDFNKTKERIMNAIQLLEKDIYSFSNREKNLDIVSESRDLKDKHFLASRSRFEVCKAALQKKELLPITMSLFDRDTIQKLSEILKKEKCQITFMNLTNVCDYDPNHTLTTTLNALPVASHCKMICTTLVELPIPHTDQYEACHCIFSTGLADLIKSLGALYQKTSSALSSHWNNVI